MTNAFCWRTCLTVDEQFAADLQTSHPPMFEPVEDGGRSHFAKAGIFLHGAEIVEHRKCAGHGGEDSMLHVLVDSKGPAQNPILGLARTIRHPFTAEVRLLFIGTRLHSDREVVRALLPVRGWPTAWCTTFGGRW
jgi:hypothetical protein